LKSPLNYLEVGLLVSYTPNNQVPQQKLYEKLKSMLSHLGMHPEHLIPRNIYMKIAIPIAGCAHQAGICRFGTNPKTSVLDTNCKAHELDNLYVVDTSFFVSIGGGEPVANRDCECDPRGRSPIAEVGVSG
jgi:choline dehydrogenase-like flavoprotein